MAAIMLMCGKRQLRSRVPWKVRSFLPCGRDSAGFLRCSWPDNSGGLMLMAEQVIAEAWHGDVIGPLVPTTMRRRYETLASYNVQRSFLPYSFFPQFFYAVLRSIPNLFPFDRDLIVPRYWIIFVISFVRFKRGLWLVILFDIFFP